MLLQKASHMPSFGGFGLRCWYAVRGQGLSDEGAARELGLPRSTLYRWDKALRERGTVGLGVKSRRPRRVGRPTWGPDLAKAVLRRMGWKVSTPMVGRILRKLKTQGLLREPPRAGISAHKRRRSRPYGVRKPKEYQATEPGDIVQVDTLDVRPLPGVALKHFTARDMVSRWDVVEVHTRATDSLAAQFLETMMRRFPFPIKAVQVDGGSEFQAQFEMACKEMGIRLFVLPPRSPKLNGHVERAQRTHTEEFYELYDGDFDIGSLNQSLLKWERI